MARRRSEDQRGRRGGHFRTGGRSGRCTVRLQRRPGELQSLQQGGSARDPLCRSRRQVRLRGGRSCQGGRPQGEVRPVGDPILQVAEYYRLQGCIANEGVVTVSLDGKLSTNWSNGPTKPISEIQSRLQPDREGYPGGRRLVPDRKHSSDQRMALRQAQGGSPPETMPLVREFRRKFLPDPRKRRFETGGGKYRTYWSPADFSKENHVRL